MLFLFTMLLFSNYLSFLWDCCTCDFFLWTKSIVSSVPQPPAPSQIKKFLRIFFQDNLKGLQWWSCSLSKCKLCFHPFLYWQMSHLVTKPTNWHVGPAKTLISLGIRPAWDFPILHGHPCCRLILIFSKVLCVCRSQAVRSGDGV